jgi:LacI family transcriptional regulator
VTIKDIAKESGYSVSTVSRVLNNRRDVSPEAKKRIDEIVAAHSFVPNNNAKHLKQITSKTIVAMIKGHSNMLFFDIIEEIQKTVEKSKYTLEVSYLDEDDNEVEQALILCRERKPLGLLFLGGNPKLFEEQFHNINVPSVLVTTDSSRLDFANLSSVTTDDSSAAECAVDYLIENGHKNIGIIGGDKSSFNTSSQRYKGCLNSFEKHKMIFQEEKYFAKARFAYDSAYRAMNDLLETVPEVTAVFAMSDMMAIGAIRAILDAHLDVPKDISVIGFDGIAMADYSNPKLTTIRQQYKTIARRSVEILFHAIDYKTSAIHEIIPFELACGESVRKV